MISNDLLLLEVLIFLVIASIFLIVLLYKINNYKKTAYYKSTHLSYFQVMFDKGRLGEYYTYTYLKSLKGYKRYLFNCYLPKDNKTTTEIDVILLHESGIYVFESKNYSGWIFGSETQKEWTQTLPTGRGRSHKSHFLNPIIQNKVHLKWLKSYLSDYPAIPFYSYIIFSDRCELKKITLTSREHHVINRYDIYKKVSANAAAAGKRLTQQQIDEIYKKLYPLTQVKEALKLAHVENIQKTYHTPR